MMNTSNTKRYQLTEIGEKELKEMHFSDRKLSLMVAIKKLQPATADAVASDTKLPQSRVGNWLEVLKAEGLVERV